MSKLKKGNYFYYKDGDGVAVCKITSINSAKKLNMRSYMSDKLFFFDVIWGKNLKKIDFHKRNDCFCKDSKVYNNSIVGKTIDELWVRMI